MINQQYYILILLGTPDGRTFNIPDEYQPTNLHKELQTSQIFAKVKKTPIQKSMDKSNKRVI